MAKRPLPSAERLRNLLDYDPETGVLRWKPRTPDMFFSWNEAGKAKRCATFNEKYAGQPALIGIDGHGYYQGTILCRYYKAHRVAWLLHYGEWPTGEIDHINGDRRDNRITNLRDVEHRTNLRNCKLSKRNTTGVPGLTWNKTMKRWQAFIRINGKSKCLGSWKNFDDAAAARKAAEVKFDYHENHGKKQNYSNHYVKRADRL